jgi:hypothetical protein
MSMTCAYEGGAVHAINVGDAARPSLDAVRRQDTSFHFQAHRRLRTIHLGTVPSELFGSWLATRRRRLLAPPGR